MATLTPVQHTDGRKAKAPRRYGIDTRTLIIKWFGGVKELDRLCEVYGVPKLTTPYSAGVADIAILLELAERMHKPIDLYQFVVEVR